MVFCFKNTPNDHSLAVDGISVNNHRYFFGIKAQEFNKKQQQR